MIKIENTEVWGFKHAIRGMRNPLNSWNKSDSGQYPCTCHCEHCDISDRCVATIDEGSCFVVGDNDLKLMMNLSKAGHPHRKYLRQIFVSVDITAPLYWWKEFDTYKVGTTANSTSTMHKIHSKEFTLDDFSHEHVTTRSLELLMMTVKYLNECRDLYVNYDTHDNSGYSKPDRKTVWWQMIQLLPTSYNQTRTVTMTYENLLNMLEYRKNHKLDEWRSFCDWIQTLPLHQVLEVGCFHE